MKEKGNGNVVVVVLALVVALFILAGIYVLPNVPFIERFQTEKPQFYFGTERNKWTTNNSFEVGSEVYMKVTFRAYSNKEYTKHATAILTIPNVENINVTYEKGQAITPNVDFNNNVTTYTFNLSVNKNSAEEVCIICFKPLAPGEIKVEFKYNDNTEFKWEEGDSNNEVDKLKFVQASQTDEISTTANEDTSINESGETTITKAAEENIMTNNEDNLITQTDEGSLTQTDGTTESTTNITTTTDYIETFTTRTEETTELKTDLTTMTGFEEQLAQ